jgi:hypothetical protein
MHQNEDKEARRQEEGKKKQPLFFSRVLGLEVREGVREGHGLSHGVQCCVRVESTWPEENKYNFVRSLWFLNFSAWGAARPSLWGRTTSQEKCCCVFYRVFRGWDRIFPVCLRIETR